MNKYKYYFDRLSIFIFSIIGTIISSFIKCDENRILFNSFQNKKYNSNSKYLFLWFIENVKNYNSYFVVNDNKLRKELNDCLGNYFVETKTFKGKIFALQAKVWVVSALEMPVGCLFAKSKRYVIHLGHGTPLKKIGLLENKISLGKKIYYALLKTNISYTLSPSTFFQPILAQFLDLPLDAVLIAGQARNDQLFIKPNFNINKLTKKPGMKNILYAPTWRPTTKLLLFPFNDFSSQGLGDFLTNNDINIFLRLHPNFESEVDAELLNIKNIYLFSGTVYDEIIDFLNIFDLLITDYSSICFDYLLLDRPMIFLPYDYESYNTEIGFTVPYNDFTPGYKPLNMKDFMKSILDSFNETTDIYSRERKKVNGICNSFRNNNREEFVKLLYGRNILKKY
ncbi:MAG: CDP-glycerol glycerophosphotransferase family protein [Bacteroidales bacterium]|jgi:CDP-glycerol glycerophosphotransferase|nr:CDP-glycerol glycerophosphotransferase family protein [Bacteroidales bacterium]